MAAAVCSVPDCGRKVTARGLCKTHYERRNSGIQDWMLPIKALLPCHGQSCSITDCDRKVMAAGLCQSHYKYTRKAKCSFDGCGRPMVSLVGLCETHYRQFQKGIELSSIKNVRPKSLTPCSIEHCGRKVEAQGLCAMHYARLQRGSDLNADYMPKNKSAKGKGRYISGDGYIVATVPHGTSGSFKRKGQSPRMLEHRYVMQCHLGRNLLPSETVHHKDGDRTNNAIDNLEVKPGQHGKGINLIDGANACLDYLERYAGLDLYERAVLSGLRDKISRETFGTVVPFTRKKHRA